jgi:hypothetical protein
MGNNMLEKLKGFLESEEGQRSMEKFAQEMKFKESRNQNNRARMRKMFKGNQESFDKLMYKIIAKHNDTYEDLCFAKGYQPYPMNILNAIHQVADEEGTDHAPLDEFTKKFPSDIVTYMNWQFAYTHGQVTVTSVYKNKELLLRL